MPSKAAMPRTHSRTLKSMRDDTDLRQRVLRAVADLAQLPPSAVNESTPLIGDGKVLDSMKLVELCLALEDIATEVGFEFDWTSDSAMSRSRGMFRNAGALANEFIAQRSARA